MINQNKSLFKDEEEKIVISKTPGNLVCTKCRNKFTCLTLIGKRELCYNCLPKEEAKNDS